MINTKFEVVIVPKYPKIEFSFFGTGGNIHVCTVKFVEALRKGGIKSEEIKSIIREATSSDKDHFFSIIRETVLVID